jgi:Zn-dependent M28 family amino/carboxypeptidase
MPVLLYDFTDVIAFGAQHSSLKDVLESALKQANLTLTPDPMPDQAIFTRSDHYRFVQQGVPSILLATGWNSTKGVGEGGTVFQSFLANTYHRPSDDLNQPIDYHAGARFAEVNFQILRAVADADARPVWNPGDFFGRPVPARASRLSGGQPARAPRRLPYGKPSAPNGTASSAW